MGFLLHSVLRNTCWPLSCLWICLTESASNILSSQALLKRLEPRDLRCPAQGISDRVIRLCVPFLFILSYETPVLLRSLHPFDSIQVFQLHTFCHCVTGNTSVCMQSRDFCLPFSIHLTMAHIKNPKRWDKVGSLFRF